MSRNELKWRENRDACCDSVLIERSLLEMLRKPEEGPREQVKLSEMWMLMPGGPSKD